MLLLIPPPLIHTAPLTVTAECLTALHAVCRISAALPGFSRFLVNLRVDSAAISSSERASTEQLAWHSDLGPAPARPLYPLPRFAPSVSCVYTRARAITHTDARERTLARTRTHTRPVAARTHAAESA